MKQQKKGKIVNYYSLLYRRIKISLITKSQNVWPTSEKPFGLKDLLKTAMALRKVTMKNSKEKCEP